MKGKVTSVKQARKLRIACLVLALFLLLISAVGAYAEEERQVTAWGNYCSNMGASYAPMNLNDQTCRMVVTLGISGDGLYIELSNKHGAEPLVLDHVTFAEVVEGTQDEIVPETVCDVLFGGEQTAFIPAGETLVSDKVEMTVLAGKEYAVSTYVSGECLVSSGNQFNARTYTSEVQGDRTSEASMLADIGGVVPFLRSIHVATADENARAFVIVGDSTSSNAWPGLLQERLEKCGLDNVSVIPRSVSGNRLMVDAAMPMFGEGVVNRFDDDVFSTEGVFAVLLKIGVNDIFQPSSQGTEAFTVEEMIAAEMKLIESAHEHGLLVYMMTITPFNGYSSWSSGSVWTEELEAMRLAWNEWIMTTDSIDGYVDLCAGMTDPFDSSKLIEKYTFDSLHPSEIGLEFIANAVPLEWFTK